MVGKDERVMSVHLIPLQRRAHNTQKAWKVRFVLNLACSCAWNGGYNCPRLSTQMQTDDGANGLLLYSGIYNARDEAHMVATSDWLFATVA